MEFLSQFGTYYLFRHVRLLGCFLFLWGGDYVFMDLHHKRALCPLTR
jgi:hypothetical protein